MTQDPEDIASMEMPCMCECGNFFDLHDGNSCRDCDKVFCTECIEEPFELCPGCKDYRELMEREESWRSV